MPAIIAVRFLVSICYTYWEEGKSHSTSLLRSEFEQPTQSAIGVFPPENHLDLHHMLPPIVESTDGTLRRSLSMGQLQQVRKKTEDDRLRNEISHLLNDQNYPSFKELSVEVDHGLVTISGTLQTYYHRQIALSTCQQLVDVITIIDMMEVGE